MTAEVSSTSYLHRIEAVYRQLYVSAGMTMVSMILANSVDRSALVVHADDPLLKQTELSLPSALPAPISGYGRGVDVAAQIVETVISAESVRRTTTPGTLLGTAVTAQLASCGADAAVERTGWLSHAERAQEDVGFSAISTAWFTKFLLDRAQTSEHNSWRWLGGMVVFAGTMVVGIPLCEGSNGGKLDFVSHAVGALVGFAAHKLSRPKVTSEQP